MRQHSQSTYYLEDDNGNVFELPFKIDGANALVILENKALIGALVTDPDAESPLEYSDCELVNFNRWQDRPSYDDFKRITRANPGRVFMHSGADNCHGPGTVYCRITSNALTVADTKNGGSDSALDSNYGYIIVPSDVTDPPRYAAAIVESYSQWCNGDVYGVCIWVYNKTENGWELDEEGRDECWGCIGYDCALETMQEELQAAKTAINERI